MLMFVLSMYSTVIHIGVLDVFSVSSKLSVVYFRSLKKVSMQMVLKCYVRNREGGFEVGMQSGALNCPAPYTK